MVVFNMGMIYLRFFVTILSASENYSKVHQQISLFEKKNNNNNFIYLTNGERIFRILTSFHGALLLLVLYWLLLHSELSCN